jgi:hypothetical protein
LSRLRLLTTWAGAVVTAVAVVLTATEIDWAIAELLMTTVWLETPFRTGAV